MMDKILTLEFSRGKVVYRDPTTFEEIYDHPVLEIGSSYAALKFEVIKWLNDNYGSDWGFKFYDGDYRLFFKSEEHKNWFIMRWL